MTDHKSSDPDYTTRKNSLPAIGGPRLDISPRAVLGRRRAAILCDGCGERQGVGPKFAEVEHPDYDPRRGSVPLILLYCPVCRG